MKKILGFKKFVSKKGVKTCIVDILTDYSARELAAGAVGQKVDQVFIFDEAMQQKINQTCIGRELIAQYDVSGQSAYLVGIEIK